MYQGLHAVPEMQMLIPCFFLLSSFCCGLLSSGPCCFLYGQLSWLPTRLLLLLQHLDSPPSLLAGLSSSCMLWLGHSSAQKASLIHDFQETEAGKHVDQVILETYVPALSYMWGPFWPSGTIHRSFNMSLLFCSITFPLGSGWHLCRLHLRNLFRNLWCFPWFFKHIGFLFALSPKRFCTSHLHLRSHFSGYLFTCSQLLIPPFMIP